MEKEKEVVIIGGGLSGLAAAWQLHRHGVSIVVLEARDRLGGRAHTLNISGAPCDVGPSWVWPGQPTVAHLLRHFNIQTFPQFCKGDLVHQAADGRVRRDPHLKPMQGALRVQGGVRNLVEALKSGLPDGCVMLGTAVHAVDLEEAGVVVRAKKGGEDLVFRAQRVAVAVPLRIAAYFAFSPGLDTGCMNHLRGTPTWMAGHAKFYAVYERAFWRMDGLSGDVFSRLGPLGEVHDASAGPSGPYAVFGFFRMESGERNGMSREILVERVLGQLEEVFGKAARKPVEARVVDWSADAWTATKADERMLDYHPEYGIPIQIPDSWRGKMDFIVSETNYENGGLMEGALQRGIWFATNTLRERNVPLHAEPAFW